MHECCILLHHMEDDKMKGGEKMKCPFLAVNKTVNKPHDGMEIHIKDEQPECMEQRCELWFEPKSMSGHCSFFVIARSAYHNFKG